MSRSAVVIKINGDAAQFNQELKKVESQTKDVSVNLGKVAAVSAVGFGALTAAIAASVAEYREGLKVERQTEAVLKSTGNAAGLTAKQVGELALALQKVTNFGDETIQGAENIILRFTNIKEDIFPQVTALALDMAAAMGGGEESVAGSAEKLGKVLNNPIKGMQLLTREGIIFSAEQKKTIETLVETGRVADAQAILLERLQSKYGGQAKAVADPFIQLKQVMGDLVQVFGSAFNPLAEKLAIALKGIAFYLLEANPQLIRIGAYLTGAAAAVLGFTAAITGGMLIYLKATAIWTAYAASAGVAATASGVFATAISGVGVAIRFALLNPIGIALTLITSLVAAFISMGGSITGVFEGLKRASQAFVDNFKTLFTKGAKANGKNIGDAFMTGYREAVAEQSKMLKPPEVPKPETAAELDAKPTGYDEIDIEAAKEKKQEKLDLEKQFADEAFRIQDEKNQLELNSEAYKANEIARIDLDEKKRRLQDEARYGKFYADQKAFWNKQEVKGTEELFGTLSTLTRSKNKEMFAIGKAASYAHALINVAQGVTRTLAEYPFPLNVALASAVGLAGAVQIATISGTTMQAKEGWSGSGSAFGESFVSTFTPREIVVPERFSEGIKKGEFSLTSSKEQQSAGGAEVTVQIGLAEDAVDVLEVKRVERQRLNIGKV